MEVLPLSLSYFSNEPKRKAIYSQNTTVCICPTCSTINTYVYCTVHLAGIDDLLLETSKVYSGFFK